MAFKFYEDYYNYVGDTEAPLIYHRWSAVSMVAALLSRSISFPFGHGAIYPNMYCLLVGTPGSRKGSALKPASNAIKLIDFKKLAPQRISPERFLIEMHGLNGFEQIDEETDLEKLNFEDPNEIYVVSDEFGDFIKTNNIDFINLLTNLWDNLDEYKHPKIHGKSVNLFQPTVNIIGATTPQGIAQCLPIEAIGQGFLSRFILVHGEPTGNKITFPKPPTEAQKSAVQARLEEIKVTVTGTLQVSDEARSLLDAIYKEYKDLDDVRFQHYNTRRFTHLLKLCIVFSAMDCCTTVAPIHVLQANTLLHVTEQRMPKALGQFGKAKHADTANAIIELLKKAPKPLNVREIWKHVSQDINKYDDLIELLKGLETADKIVNMKIGEKTGFVAVNPKASEWRPEFLIQSEFLFPEERI